MGAKAKERFTPAAVDCAQFARNRRNKPRRRKFCAKRHCWGPLGRLGVHDSDRAGRLYGSSGRGGLRWGCIAVSVQLVAKKRPTVWCLR